jgi:hypothetical protein
MPGHFDASHPFQIIKAVSPFDTLIDIGPSQALTEVQQIAETARFRAILSR